MKTIAKVLGIITILVVVIFAGSIGEIIGKLTSERFLEGKKEGAINAALVNVADNMNKRTPIMINSNTRFDTVLVVNQELWYKYTLVNNKAEEIKVSEFDQITRPNLINHVCTSMKFFVDNNISVSYLYYGKNGKKITSIKIPASSCRSDD